MKALLLAFLSLTLPLSARTPARPTPRPTPPAVVAAPEPAPITQSPGAVPAVPMARARTVQEDLELRDWIVGLQTTAQNAVKEADAAKLDAKTSQEQSSISTFQSLQATKQLLTVDAQYARQEKELAAAKVKLARFSKLVTLLALVAALAAALYTFEMLKPAGLLGKALSITGPGLQYGAPIAVFLFAFGAVQIYLRYLF